MTRATPDVHESYDERVSQILDIATEVIAREGYEKASMRTVAAAVGVSLAGLYHYFESKERMLFLIQFRTFTALLYRAKERLYGIDDPIEQLRVLVRHHVDYFASHLAALKTCSHELDSLTGEAFEETRQVRRSYYELVRSIVDQALDLYAPGSTLDRHVATMSLFGTLNWLYRWYHPKRGPAPATVADQIVDQLLHGVLGSDGVPGGRRAATNKSPRSSEPTDGSAPASEPGPSELM